MVLTTGKIENEQDRINERRVAVSLQRLVVQLYRLEKRHNSLWVVEVAVIQPQRQCVADAVRRVLVQPEVVVQLAHSFFQVLMSFIVAKIALFSRIAKCYLFIDINLLLFN